MSYFFTEKNKTVRSTDVLVLLYYTSTIYTNIAPNL